MAAPMATAESSKTAGGACQCEFSFWIACLAEALEHVWTSKSDLKDRKAFVNVSGVCYELFANL